MNIDIPSACSKAGSWILFVGLGAVVVSMVEASDPPPPSRVLVSPSGRATTATPPADAGTARAANTVAGSAAQPAAIPQKELMPLIDRVRALEAEVTKLRALLLDQRRENAAALAALRGQVAAIRGNFDSHSHRLVTGCVPAGNIYPKSELDGCVFVSLGGGAMPPGTGGPIVIGQ